MSGDLSDSRHSRGLYYRSLLHGGLHQFRVRDNFCLLYHWRLFHSLVGFTHLLLKIAVSSQHNLLNLRHLIENGLHFIGNSLVPLLVPHVFTLTLNEGLTQFCHESRSLPDLSIRRIIESVDHNCLIALGLLF